MNVTEVPRLLQTFARLVISFRNLGESSGCDSFPSPVSYPIFVPLQPLASNRGGVGFSELIQFFFWWLFNPFFSLTIQKCCTGSNLHLGVSLLVLQPKVWAAHLLNTNWTIIPSPDSWTLPLSEVKDLSLFLSGFIISKINFSSVAGRWGWCLFGELWRQNADPSTRTDYFWLLSSFLGNGQKEA